MKTIYPDYRLMDDKELFNILNTKLGISDPNWMNSIDNINTYVLNQDEIFQRRFVINVYLMVGHHDNNHIDAVLSSARIRIWALLTTLNN